MSDNEAHLLRSAVKSEIEQDWLKEAVTYHLNDLIRQNWESDRKLTMSLIGAGMLFAIAAATYWVAKLDIGWVIGAVAFVLLIFAADAYSSREHSNIHRRGFADRLYRQGFVLDYENATRKSPAKVTEVRRYEASRIAELPLFR